MIVLIVILVLGLGARTGRLPLWQRSLGHRWAPAVIGAVTLLAFLRVINGDRDPAAVISDEASYKFQASLFAAGRWTDTAPTQPEVFRQMYVLDSAVRASKYPPGHALALAPGFLIGLPFLAPLLCVAAVGGLLFAMGRRLLSPEAGLVTWLCWLGSSGTYRWGATWYSETSSGLLMLVGWWLSLRRPFTNRTAIALGAVTGYLAITRPLTAVTFVIPIGVIMLIEAWQRRSARHIAFASLAALPVLAILPLWSWRTTGDAAVAPIEQYTARHLPVDRMGFTPILRTGPTPLRDDQAEVEAFLFELHGDHSPRSYLPNIAGRLRLFIAEHTPGPIKILYPLLVVGLVMVPWRLGATLALQYAAYGVYAHPVDWSLYYAELAPLAALAIGASTFWLMGRLKPQLIPVAWATMAALLAAVAWTRIEASRVWWAGRGPEIRQFRAATDTLPDRSLVLVEYAPKHNPHHALVTNLGPLDDQRVIVGYDRGEVENLKLASSLGRRGFLYRESSASLIPLEVADTSAGSGAAATAP